MTSPYYICPLYPLHEQIFHLKSIFQKMQKYLQAREICHLGFALKEVITANHSMDPSPVGGQRTLELPTKQHISGFFKELESTSHKIQASKNSVTLQWERKRIPETSVPPKKEAAMKCDKSTLLLSFVQQPRP